MYTFGHFQYYFIVSVCSILQPIKLHSNIILQKNQTWVKTAENDHFQDVHIFSRILFVWPICNKPPTPFHANRKKTYKLMDDPLPVFGKVAVKISESLNLAALAASTASRGKVAPGSQYPGLYSYISGSVSNRDKSNGVSAMVEIGCSYENVTDFYVRSSSCALEFILYNVFTYKKKKM